MHNKNEPWSTPALIPVRLDRPSAIVATVGGLGMLPWMPGSWCSLVVALPALGPWLFGWDTEWVRLGYLIATVAFGVGGMIAIPHVQRRWGSDPGPVVVDEAFGISLVGILPFMYWVPPYWWALAVFLFRLFDIRKPWPANVINRRHEAWAVMADDGIAALYTIVTMQLLFLATQALIVLG